VQDVRVISVLRARCYAFSVFGRILLRKTGLSAPIPQPPCGRLAGFPLQSLAQEMLVRRFHRLEAALCHKISAICGHFNFPFAKNGEKGQIGKKGLKIPVFWGKKSSKPGKNPMTKF
jgi:hypothetical protein